MKKVAGKKARRKKTVVAKKKIDLKLRWYSTLEEVRNYVVHIKTSSGSGTGFLVASDEKENVVGIATALHVISHANEWELPIKVTHHTSGRTVMVKTTDRLIHCEDKTDSALLILSKDALPLPKSPLTLIEKNKYIREGVELGWCGFPSVATKKLCFFSGRVSAWLGGEDAYLVDGVVIHGVSGAPAFDITNRIAGFVTAYIANRATGEALPGVGLIRSIRPFIDLFEVVKKAFAQAAKKSQASTPKEESKDKK